jgi:uncharacterized membrane protein YcaP (DUF421 family)
MTSREASVDYQDLAWTALRATTIYVFLLVVLRVMGKRAVGDATAFDFMVALILGEVVDEPIYGDAPLLQGLVVIAVIAGWHAVNSYLSYRSQRFDRLTGGSPTILIRYGVIDRKAMRRERMNDAELWTLLRLQGVDDLRDVKEATLEPDGELSVIKTDAARELTRADVARLLGRAA